MVYPGHIQQLPLPSYNIPGTLYPAKESFCILQTLIKAIDVFKLMTTRFYLESIFWGYTRDIPGVYTWYIPGICKGKLSGNSRCPGLSSGPGEDPTAQDRPGRRIWGDGPAARRAGHCQVRAQQSESGKASAHDGGAALRSGARWRSGFIVCD